jgi:hypothetical protein
MMRDHFMSGLVNASVAIAPLKQVSEAGHPQSGGLCSWQSHLIDGPASLFWKSCPQVYMVVRVERVTSRPSQGGTNTNGVNNIC